MAKPKLLYLCHRIPYPPNKGDKIRSFNLLKALAEQYEVYLGCFIDDEYDFQYIDKLADWCVEYKCRRLRKSFAKLKGLSAFLTNKPITLPYYADHELQHWVHQVIEKHQIDTVMVFSSSMAQYVDEEQYKTLHRVIDFVDVDSDKWRQYADNQRGVMSWVYRRESRQLLRLEQRYCENFNYSLFVSPDEAQLFRSLMPAILNDKIQPLLNGVDVRFFDPAATVKTPEYTLQIPYLVFTGAMDYWANVDAVLWFFQQVWPQLRAQRPELHFYIVGGNPTAEVLALHGHQQVWVTGRVDDVRPYIRSAELVVAPLRIARGIQNKVLEAMALNKKIVASDMAMEGINAPKSPYLVQSDDATEFLRLCLAMLQQEDALCTNREWVQQHFTWPVTLTPLPGYLQHAEK